MADETVLTDVILKAQKNGNGVMSLPYNEQIFVVDDDKSTVKYIRRETLRRVSTPQACVFGKDVMQRSPDKEWQLMLLRHENSYCRLCQERNVYMITETAVMWG